MDLSILEFSKILLNVNILFFVVCSFLYLNYWKSINKVYKILTIYLVFVTIIQVAFRLTFNFSINNWIITNIFLVGQVVFIYKNNIEVLKKNFSIFFLKVVTLCFFVLFTSTFIMNTNLIFEINEILAFSVTFIFIGFSMLYWYENIGNKIKYFYLVLAGLLYHFGSIFVFIYADIFLKNNTFFALIVYNFHTFLAIIYTIVVIIEYRVNILKKSKEVIADKI